MLSERTGEYAKTRDNKKPQSQNGLVTTACVVALFLFFVYGFTERAIKLLPHKNPAR